MTKSKYSENLLDPRWQKKRLKIFKRDNWACQKCGDTKSTLNVHHKVYWPNAKPWEARDCWLLTLCESCHSQEKQRIIENRIALNFVIESFFLSNDVSEIIKGFRDLCIKNNGEDTAKLIRFVLSDKKAIETLKILYENKNSEVQ